ncbi:MAG TPA: hypothetical protein VGN64_03270 [Dyadobacter sp.]|jgi:hypothetical protein|nr:hypothetical protein [Dyadobacter sp.]
MQKNLIVILLVFVVASCAPKVKTNLTSKHAALSYDEDVIVLEKLDSIPASSEILGTVKIGDAGMSTNCNFTQVIAKAKEQARIAGGNSIRIIEHKSPDFMSSCHRIVAEVIRLDTESLTRINSVDEFVDPTMDYSILHVYRPRGTGGLVSYNLYLDNSLICRVTNKSRQQIRVKQTGSAELWAKTESKASIPIRLVNGRQYYIRCSVAMGVMVGRPSFELVSEKIGKKEIAALR